MARDIAALEARFRERLASTLELRAKLLSKALRDPARFLADARSPFVRGLGDLVVELGLLPAVDDAHAAVRAPRHVPLGHRDPEQGSREPVVEGRLEAVRGNRLSGFARSGAFPAALVACVDGREVAHFVAAQRRGAQAARDAFDVCVDLTPDGMRPGDEVTVRVACAVSGRDLEGSPTRVRTPRYEGAITRCRHGYVKGHLRDVITGHPVHVDVLVDGRDVARLSVEGRRTLPHPSFARILCAFSASYVPRRTDTEVVLRVRGRAGAVLGTPRAFDRAVAPAPGATPSHRAHAALVHVIVPVYAGVEITMRCVESALRARNDVASVITVIYDAGPDPRLLEALRARASGGAFELLVNDENLGFVRTCNRGMRLRPDADVVLLNADTEVSDGWLDRLARAARAGEDVGTATPFSNAATICSFPVLGEEAPLPEGTSVAELSARFAATNDGDVVELPTGHGFCLFIRRAMLDAVGLFDEEAFGRGYGEENDLCLRGRARGFRHVLACDAFVMHVGSVSFAGERPARVRHALATLAHRYPFYDDDVGAFIRRDPLAPFRNRVVVAMLRERSIRATRTILMVTHHLGGGIAKHVRDLTDALVREGVLVLELRSHEDGSLRLRVEAASLEAVYPRADETALLSDLRAIGVGHVHYHHWLTLPGHALGLADALGLPFDVTLHDFFAACPRVSFVRADGTYCGEPEALACNTCIATDRVHETARFCETVPASDVPTWRAMHRAFFDRARVVFAPSVDTADRTTRALGAFPIRVLPHPEPPARIRFRSTRGHGPVHVAVLGGIGLHKGYLRLLEVAQHAHAEELPLRFTVFGTTIDAGALRRLPNVTVTGRYTPEALPALVERSACTVAAFFSIWPETFSYTLSEAITLGLHPVSFDLGAPGERLRAFGHGTLVAPSATAEEICRALLAAGRAGDEGPLHGPFAAYASLVRDYYALPPVEIA